MPVGREAAPALGIMQLGEGNRVARFVEKPQGPALLDSLRLRSGGHGRDWVLQPATGELFLASMGIYVFNRDVLLELLDNTLTDFGKHIIPAAIDSQRVFAYVFHGYWEDIGTIRSFFEANLDATRELPRFNFFDMAAPIFSRPRFLPGSKINGAQIDHAVISDGCIINPLADRAQHHRPAQHRGRGHGAASRRHVRQRLLRIRRLDPRRRGARLAAHRHRREHAASRTRSSTRTRASATTSSSRRPASRRISTTISTTSATAS